MAGGVRYLRIARTNRERRADLERLGWRIEEISAADNSVVMQPDRVAPLVSAFLASVLR